MMEKSNHTRMRVPYDINVNLTGKDFSPLKGVCKDISLSGIYLEIPQVMPLNSNCCLSISLPNTEPSITLKVKGKVTRYSDKGVGIQFCEMDYDTFDHLKKIIYFNTDCPEDFIEQCEKFPGFK